ncbi:hypothetical protein ABKN59_003419 [Abortiporus biennis]
MGIFTNILEISRYRMLLLMGFGFSLVRLSNEDTPLRLSTPARSLDSAADRLRTPDCSDVYRNSSFCLLSFSPRPSNGSNILLFDHPRPSSQYITVKFLAKIPGLVFQIRPKRQRRRIPRLETFAILFGWSKAVTDVGQDANHQFFRVEIVN